MEYSQEEYAKLGSVLQYKSRSQILQYELIDIVGRGSCGAVYLAQLTTSPFTLYAVKTLAKNALKPQMCEEISIHRMVSWHPSVVSLEFVIESNDTIYIGLEYCEGGDLYDGITVGNLTNCSEEEMEVDSSYMLKGNGRLKTNRDELVRNLFLEILNAVDFCHSRGVYHRDLKPENILLDKKSRIKLADFGLATRAVWSKEYGCGSCFYMAPEAHKPKKSTNQTGAPGSKTHSSYCTPAADIWSLGIIFLNLCFGRNPWKRACTEDPAFLEYIFNPSLLASMFPLSSEGHKLVSKMLCINPMRRITLPELIKYVSTCKNFIKPKLTNRAKPNIFSLDFENEQSQRFVTDRMKASISSGTTLNSRVDYIKSHQAKLEDKVSKPDRMEPIDSGVDEDNDFDMEDSLPTNHVDSEFLNSTYMSVESDHQPEILPTNSHLTKPNLLVDGINNLSISKLEINSNQLPNIRTSQLRSNYNEHSTKEVDERREKLRTPFKKAAIEPNMLGMNQPIQSMAYWSCESSVED